MFNGGQVTLLPFRPKTVREVLALQARGNHSDPSVPVGTCCQNVMSADWDLPRGTGWAPRTHLCVVSRDRACTPLSRAKGSCLLCRPSRNAFGGPSPSLSLILHQGTLDLDVVVPDSCVSDKAGQVGLGTGLPILSESLRCCPCSDTQWDLGHPTLLSRTQRRGPRSAPASPWPPRRVPCSCCANVPGRPGKGECYLFLYCVYFVVVCWFPVSLRATLTSIVSSILCVE